jgi:hypothetical protein
VHEQKPKGRTTKFRNLEQWGYAIERKSSKLGDEELAVVNRSQFKGGHLPDAYWGSEPRIRHSLSSMAGASPYTCRVRMPVATYIIRTYHRSMRPNSQTLSLHQRPSTPSPAKSNSGPCISTQTDFGWVMQFALCLVPMCYSFTPGA